MIVADPLPEDWNKVQRYAPWMRKVHLDDWLVLGEDAILKLRLNSPVGGWFPALQKFTRSTLPYASLCFSPHLSKVSIKMALIGGSGVPRDILPTVASALSALPTSNLQSLRADVGYDVPWTYYKDTFSSLLLHCGPSLTKFACRAPLSDAAINHLVHLPNLHSWTTNSPPPNYSTSPLPVPLGFPPLTQFTLGGDSARGWISLFGRLATGVPCVGGTTPLSKTRESLETLNIIKFPNPIIDVSVVSPIQIFHNLAFLNVVANCVDRDDDGQCTFELNDDDIARLTMALPRLTFLRLGHPCSKNTCATTIACLLSISVHCLELKSLWIHFNTRDIVEDFKSVSTDPRFEQLRSLPRCPLSRLEVWRVPLTLDEPGFEVVVNGVIDIFPSLEFCNGLERAWEGVSERISKLREM